MAGSSTYPNIIAGLFEAFDSEIITIADSPKGFSESKYVDSDGGKALRAIVTVEDGQLRYWYDGTDPTSSEGHLVNPMDVFVIMNSSNIVKFRAIKVGSASGTLSVTFEK